MATLADYNTLVCELQEDAEYNFGRYTYEDPKDRSLESMGSLVNIFLSVHDHAETCATLRRLEDKADAKTKEILHDLATLLEKVNKEGEFEE